MIPLTMQHRSAKELAQDTFMSLKKTCRKLGVNF